MAVGSELLEAISAIFWLANEDFVLFIIPEYWTIDDLYSLQTKHLLYRMWWLSFLCLHCIRRVWQCPDIRVYRVTKCLDTSGCNILIDTTGIALVGATLRSYLTLCRRYSMLDSVSRLKIFVTLTLLWSLTFTWHLKSLANRHSFKVQDLHHLPKNRFDISLVGILDPLMHLFAPTTGRAIRVRALMKPLTVG